jgi:hypothetical protein
MLWYKAGVETSQCHKVQLQTGREILACLGEDGYPGGVVTELYVEDLLNPRAALRAEEAAPFLRAVDSSFGCVSYSEDETESFTLTRAFIEKVEFPAMPSGDAGLGISVTASFGQRSITPPITRSCVTSPTGFIPPVKSYHLDFVFDGHDYKPMAASAETARMFESR